MKFTCVRENLVRGLAPVGEVVPQRTSLPILRNMLVRAEDGRLTLTGSDLDTTVVAEVRALIERDGVAAIPGRMLREYVGSMTEGVIEFELDPDNDKRVIIRGPSCTGHMSIEDTEYYPPVPGIEDALVSLEMEPAVLMDGLTRSLPAVSTSDTRPVLACLKMELSGDGMTLAAADGYRLSIYEYGAEEFSVDGEIGEGGVDLLLRRSSVARLERMLGRVEGPVRLMATDKHAMFEMNGVRLVCSVVEGDFPVYERLVPSGWKTRVVVDHDALLAAVNSVSALRGAGDALIRMEFEREDEDATMRVSVRTEDVGSGAGEIGVRMEGDGGRVAFDGGFLKDALRCIEGPVALEFEEMRTGPALMRPAETDSVGVYRHLLMPMQVASW